MSQPRTWMVRAGEGAFRVEEFLEKGIVSIGWHLGDLSHYTTLEQIRALYQQTYPHHKPGKFILCSGQVYRFRSEIRIGDYVMTYNPQDRTYSIGTVTSDYEYHPEDAEQPNWRRVTWNRKVNRDGLSTATKNKLGSAMTLFLVDEDAVDELNGKPVARQAEAVQPEEDALDAIKEDFEEKAHEFIKDKIQQLGRNAFSNWLRTSCV